MDFKPILEVLNREHVSGDEITNGFLRDAVTNFSANPASAISVIRRIQASDPSGFALAAVQLLVTAEEQSPGLRFVAGLVTTGSLLIDLLLDERFLTLEAAIPLARNVAAVEPLLDVRLVGKLLASAGDDASATRSSAALRVLGLVDAISNCSRLASYLVRFLHHPSAKVRSKAALLLGRANWNLNRVQRILASNDDRTRANALEPLWGHREQDVRDILWEAAKDPCSRVAVNALLGLCRAGDRDARAHLEKLATARDPTVRSGVAWAMGETGDPEFAEALDQLRQDGNARVRDMAEKSRQRLRSPETPEQPGTESRREANGARRY